jgi:molybdenum cofactor cytidylyltransferase
MPEGPSIEGVILAAGMSTRAGAFKPALPIGGRPMLVRAIEGMCHFCRRIFVVGGYEIGQIRLLVEDMDGVECIENLFYTKGMLTSVKAGLTAVRADRCFVLPVDIPLVPPVVYTRLLSVDADIVIPVYRGRKGHPVCLAKAVLPRILREPDDSSLRAVIKEQGACTVDVDTEEILIDVDTPQDYEAICRRFV